MGMGPKTAITKEVFASGPEFTGHPDFNSLYGGVNHLVRSKWDYAGKLLGWNMYIGGGLVTFLGGSQGQDIDVNEAMSWLLANSSRLTLNRWHRGISSQT
jgi:hypothetical protein